jgi:glycerol uptake facilitator-like aquaporin
LIEALSSVSGAHFNPVVTFALLLTHDIDGRRMASYIPAQFAGGFVGVIATHLMFYDTIPTLLVISENVKTPGLWFAEFLGTFILLGVILGCLRARSMHLSLSVGAVVGGMLITTSSTMYANPVVTFARMFTYAICGIAPQSALFFVAAEIIASVVAAKTFAHLYPKKLGGELAHHPRHRQESEASD